MARDHCIPGVSAERIGPVRSAHGSCQSGQKCAGFVSEWSEVRRIRVRVVRSAQESYQSGQKCADFVSEWSEVGRVRLRAVRSAQGS